MRHKTITAVYAAGVHTAETPLSLLSPELYSYSYNRCAALCWRSCWLIGCYFSLQPSLKNSAETKSSTHNSIIFTDNYGDSQTF